MAVEVPAEQVAQCDYAAHRRLLEGTLSNEEKMEMKAIICGAANLRSSADACCNFSCAILQRLMRLMGLPCIAERSGDEYVVSYVLHVNEERYHFRRYPDYILEKEDVGVGRILVATGEIQSTRNPTVQNSIYGVGNLLQSGGRPILCIMLLKSRCVQLSIARLHSDESQRGREGRRGQGGTSGNGYPQICREP